MPKKHVEDLDDIELNEEPELVEETEPPEPKVGDADYDWSAHYDTEDLYTHTFADGKVVVLKSFRSIFSKTWLYKMREMPTNVDVEMAAIDRGACETAREFLLSLDDSEGDPLNELYEAWVSGGTKEANAGKGLTPGE
jgi:hypothetical protein